MRESVDHTRGRLVFGKPLFEQPLMRVTLLPLMLEAEAALSLVLEAATRLDAADAGDGQAARLIRVLTPLAKHTVCKQARHVTAEAMEVRGGNGYIEDWINPRLLRDAHLGSIWEGSSNVIALDVLRCLRKEQAHHSLADTYTLRLAALSAPAVKAAAQDLTDRWARLCARADELVKGDDFNAQANMGRYADDACRTVMATLLLEQADREIAAGLGYRKLLVAHTYLHRILASPPVPAPPALEALDQIADGGWVSAHLAHAAYEAIAAAAQA